MNYSIFKPKAEEDTWTLDTKRKRLIESEAKKI